METIDDILASRIVGTNVQLCPCCNQPRPCPTEPGEWEYCEAPYFRPQKWVRVSVKKPLPDDREGQEGLRLWCNGEMIWWPSNVTWRKVE